MTYVSRRIQKSFETSQDTFEWIIQKRLKTLRINIECVLRRFRMIFRNVSRHFGNFSKCLYSKCLETLLNDSFKSVLRHFEWFLNSSQDAGQFSNESSQSNIKVWYMFDKNSNGFIEVDELRVSISQHKKWPLIAMPLDENRIPLHIHRFSNNFENS